jgi:hypothetical protein
VKRLLILAIVLIGWVDPAPAQIEWTPYENNPVIDASFDIESQAIYRPSVVFWQGRYHMWYGKLWQQRRWVAYATSEDGITWELADNAILGPSSREDTFDQLDATYASVVLDGDTLKMWYAGRGNTDNGIGYAWSTNGYDWTKVAGDAGQNSVLNPATDGTGASILTLPTVVKHEGVFHMWYGRSRPATTVIDYEMRLGYAISSDGLHWQVISGNGTNGSVLDLGEQGAFDEFAVQWPATLHNGTEFEMWYQGVGIHPTFGLVPRIGCARSLDGVEWTKVSDSAAEAGECFRTLGQPSVILEDDVYKMWYALSGLESGGDVVRYATSIKTSTSIEQNEIPALAGSFNIYPNPTQNQAHVRFSLARSSRVGMEVRDLLGREVQTINLGHQSPGEHIVTWAGADSGGASVPSGAYIVSIVDRDTGARSTGGIVHIVR